eukprot:1160178-Pelagomonas_calceolata.AAC.1
MKHPKKNFIEVSYTTLLNGQVCAHVAQNGQGTFVQHLFSFAPPSSTSCLGDFMNLTILDDVLGLAKFASVCLKCCDHHAFSTCSLERTTLVTSTLLALAQLSV